MFAALLVGLALSVGRPGERALLALVVTGVYTLLLYALVFEYGYVSRRHVFPMLVVGFGWVALGVEAVGRGGLVLARRWGVRAGPAAAATLGLVLVSVIPLTRQLEPKRIDKLAERRAADWLHANAPGPGAVAADRRRVAEYAHARFVSLRTLRSPDRIAELRKRGARYVVADDPAILDRLGLLRSEGVRLIHHEVGDGQEAWVFELPPP